MEREVSQDRIWVARVFAEAGCRLLVLPSAERILDRLWALKTGQIDFLSAGTPLPERSDYAWFSVPYGQEKIVLVVHQALAPTLKINSLSDLVDSQRTVIAPHFGYYGPDWDASKISLEQRGRLEIYKNWGKARGLLWRKPEHILLIVEDAALDVVAHPKPALVILPKALYQSDVVFMFSRATVTAVEVHLINAAITRLLARGIRPNETLSSGEP